MHLFLFFEFSYTYFSEGRAPLRKNIHLYSGGGLPTPMLRLGLVLTYTDVHLLY